MEKNKVYVEFNDESSRNLEIYNVSDIDELEEGTLFGTITDVYKMHAIYPTCSFDEGQLYYEWEDIDLEFPGSEFDNGKKIPLIFKKLDGNRAQELLSGEVFIVTSSFKKMFGPDSWKKDLSDLKKDFKQYEKENVVIEPLARPTFSDQDITAIFEVNDEFKLFYSEETLKDRDEIDEIKAVLIYAKEQGCDIYRETLKNFMYIVECVAESDNIIYDFENTDHSSKKL